MYYKYFLIPFIFLVSCDSYENTKLFKENLKIIEINEEEIHQTIDLSQFVESISYLILKTPNTFISSIEDIKVFEQKIFIYEKQKSRILIFDAISGEIISRIQSQGQGPEEYNDITFFDINEKNRTVVIYDLRGGAIYNFQFNGSFQSRLPARVICRDFSMANDGGYYFYSPDETNTFNDILIQPGLLYMNKNGNELSNLIPIGSEQYYPLLGSGKSLLKSEDYTYLISNYCDTIYTVSGTKVLQKTLLKYKTPMDQSSLDNINIDISKLGYPILKLKPFISKKYIGFSFLYNGRAQSLFHNKDQNETKVYKQVTNDINKVPFVFNGKLVNEGEHYICIIDETLIEAFIRLLEFDELSESEKSKLKEFIAIFRNTQNPILAIGSTL